MGTILQKLSRTLSAQDSRYILVLTTYPYELIVLLDSFWFWLTSRRLRVSSKWMSVDRLWYANGGILGSWTNTWPGKFFEEDELELFRSDEPENKMKSSNVFTELQMERSDLTLKIRHIQVRLHHIRTDRTYSTLLCMYIEWSSLTTFIARMAWRRLGTMFTRRRRHCTLFRNGRKTSMLWRIISENFSIVQ